MLTLLVLTIIFLIIVMIRNKISNSNKIDHLNREISSLKNAYNIANTKRTLDIISKITPPPPAPVLTKPTHTVNDRRNSSKTSSPRMSSPSSSVSSRSSSSRSSYSSSSSDYDAPSSSSFFDSCFGSSDSGSCSDSGGGSDGGGCGGGD